jgi:hypothetical protein
MKKLLFIISITITSLTFTNAQEVGLRFGAINNTGSVALDGVFGLGQFSRIHADLAFSSHGVSVDALWDFLYRPLGPEAFNWYVGAGPYAFLGNPFTLGIAGEVGLEYNFKSVPIALGLDWRPQFELIQNTSFHAGGFGLNVRWNFGK